MKDNSSIQYISINSSTIRDINTNSSAIRYYIINSSRITLPTVGIRMEKPTCDVINIEILKNPVTIVYFLESI